MHISLSIRLFPLIPEAGEIPIAEHYSRTVSCSAVSPVLKLKVITNLIDPVVECRPDFNFACECSQTSPRGMLIPFGGQV
ncbi:hypothetical protein CEXT_99681 [Caerostris extrusa]|uniref:Uncharacterized protein n=1 Tax=Caerostris extrusa TaxID=172846 RepID=A0AAV4SUI0_CAEEX|nr:hypothetical protein CEXT_99681 [Caerostris extrusa]